MRGPEGKFNTLGLCARLSFFIMVLVLCIAGFRLEGCVGEHHAVWYGIHSRVSRLDWGVHRPSLLS